VLPVCSQGRPVTKKGLQAVTLSARLDLRSERCCVGLAEVGRLVGVRSGQNASVSVCNNKTSSDKRRL
jgi:hypothetical protein